METNIIASRYELLERVGMGGMAIVYKAKDIMLGRFVAVKILREEFKENEDFIRRFKIESQAAASLSHQNIAQIYDVGEEDGMQYIVMEFLEGETLKKYILSKDGKLPRREAINYSMQICRALEHAHSKYVVHRDIKPQNIVLTESGKIKLADFGIARAANNSTTVNAKSNMAVGSAHYLSPEQARGGYTDHRSDIYSLGVVMYEMFCGKLPFDAEESVSVVMKHLHEEPVRPCEVNPDLPLGIEAIILKAMQKEQRLRYDNASEILEDLVMVYQNPSVDVSLLNASAGKTAPVQKKPEGVITRSERPERQTRTNTKKKKSHTGLIVALSLFAVAIIAFVILVWSLFFSDTGKEVEIPNLIGMTFEEAVLTARKSSVDDIEFTVTESHYEFSDRKAGTILDQSPSGGEKIKRSREITVVISKGPVAVQLEDYTGRKYENVQKELEKRDIIVKIEVETNDEYNEGIIFNQNPQEGTQLAAGETVTLYVSAETTYTIVPNLLGMTKEQARIELEENGLEAGSITEENTDKYAKGEVSYQSKEANDRVPEGTVIDLKISTGKEPEQEDDKDENKDNDTENKPDTPTKKTVALTLYNLPTNKDTVRIKLVSDGNVYYEKDFSTKSGSATIEIVTDKSLSLDVYYDGTYINTKEVAY